MVEYKKGRYRDATILMNRALTYANQYEIKDPDILDQVNYMLYKLYKKSATTAKLAENHKKQLVELKPGSVEAKKAENPVSAIPMEKVE